ncbi:MAG: diacylglycerol kinase family protein [Ignavibacteriaceae bacterium]
MNNSHQRVGIVINSSAGTIKNGGVSIRKLKEIFESLQIEAEIIKMDGNPLEDSARFLLYKGIDAIIAAGGDGTINTVAAVAIKHNIPLGVIPLGTLNHFAKDLNIPLNVKEAAEVIARKKTILVDVGEVNGNIYLNNSSIGLYPKLVKHRDKQIETLQNKWLAMFTAFLNILKRFPLMEVKIISDMEHVHCKTPFVFIGNNEYKMDLFNMGTREKITAGLLSLYYPVVTGRLSMFRFLFQALIKNLKQEKDFKIETVTGLTIESKKKHLEVSVDGEVIHLQPPLNYKILPLELNVIIP